MAELPLPDQGIVLTHFVVSDDVERSRRFYTDVLGGETVREGEPSMVALENGWVIINAGGGPTDDKPDVTLEAPRSLDRVSSFLNIPRGGHPGDLPRVERAGSAVPDAAAGSGRRDPLLPARSRRAPDRGRTDDGRPAGAGGVTGPGRVFGVGPSCAGSAREELTPRLSIALRVDAGVTAELVAAGARAPGPAASGPAASGPAGARAAPA